MGTAKLLKRVADVLTVLGLVVLVVGLVTTTGALAILGVVLIVASIVAAGLRRMVARSSR